MLKVYYFHCINENIQKLQICVKIVDYISCKRGKKILVYIRMWNGEQNKTLLAYTSSKTSSSAVCFTVIGRLLFIIYCAVIYPPMEHFISEDPIKYSHTNIVYLLKNILQQFWNIENYLQVVIAINIFRHTLCIMRRQ